MDSGRLLAELREAELVLATKLPRRSLSAIEIFGQALRQVRGLGWVAPNPVPCGWLGITHRHQARNEYLRAG